MTPRNQVVKTVTRSTAKKIVAIIATIQTAHTAMKMNMRDIYQKDMAVATTMTEENGRQENEVNGAHRKL